MKMKVKYFSELRLEELYKVLKLRSEIFVVEQDCAYQDMDDLDQASTHILGNEGEKLVAYTRIIPPSELDRDIVAIGRLVVSGDYRNREYGKMLMKKAIQISKEKFLDFPIYIKAQNYLESFYKELGFIPSGIYFLEDNIPHQEMKLVV